MAKQQLGVHMAPQQAWALVRRDARGGNRPDRLALISGQCPVFWLRKVAAREQEKHPWTVIVPVVVNQVFGK